MPVSMPVQQGFDEEDEKYEPVQFHDHADRVRAKYDAEHKDMARRQRDVAEFALNSILPLLFDDDTALAAQIAKGSVDINATYGIAPNMTRV